MKQLVIPLTEEQQALIKLTATSLDAKAATWLQTAKNKAGEDFQPDRDIDVLLLNGAVQFACRQITCEKDVRELQAAVNLKMRYNELRKD